MPLSFDHPSSFTDDDLHGHAEGYLRNGATCHDAHLQLLSTYVFNFVYFCLTIVHIVNYFTYLLSFDHPSKCTDDDLHGLCEVYSGNGASCHVVHLQVLSTAVVYSSLDRLIFTSWRAVMAVIASGTLK